MTAAAADPAERAATRAAVEALADRDPDIARAYAGCGLPPPRRRPAGFGGLLQIIVAQQVSAASAAAILGRLAGLADPLTPEAYLDLGEAALRGIGFSERKWRYGKALAEDLLAGRLDLAEVAGMDDAAAVAELSRVKGIGRWSAEIYLLFALGRPDVWPVDDLAVRAAVRRLKGLDDMPDRDAMEAVAEPWRPYRSTAARLMWHVYRHPGLPEKALS